MKTTTSLPRRSRLALSISLAVSAAVSLSGMGNYAMAQDEESVEEIVVTGSRIRRKDFDANSPIVTIGQETFEDTSTVGLDTILNQLPQFVPGMTGATSGNPNASPNAAQQFGTGGSQFAAGGIEASAFATPGTSSVSLRGLGAGRSLVLIDGRRGMPVNASMTVDLNTIPTSAIERVEVVSGGASATYGADAVAGAINFILKDDFEGLDIRTTYGESRYGDSAQLQVSALFGVNSADGRGNVMVGLDHTSRGRGDFNERDWFDDERRDPRVNGNALFYTDTWIGFFGGGLSNSSNPAQAATIDGLFPGVPDITGNAIFYVNRTPDGTGSVYTGGGFFGNTREPQGGYRYEGPLDDANGFPFRKVDPEGGIAENQSTNWISVPLERYSMFARGKYDLSENVSMFSDITYTRSITKTSNQFSPAVTGWAAWVPHGDDRYSDSFVDSDAANLGYNPDGTINWDPTALTKSQFQSGGSLGLDCPAVGGCSNTQAFPMPAEVSALADTAPGDSIRVSRVLDFLGERQTETTTNTYQFIVGLEGETDSGYYWDVSVSHGESEAVTNLLNFASLARYTAVMSQANYGAGFVATGNELGGNWGAGTATCTTGLPIFRDFEISSDCADAVRANLSQVGRMEQTAFDANIGGDLFDLPTGTVQFAAGVSWRKNEYKYQSSDNNLPSNFLDQAIGLYPNGSTDGKISVKEVFAELLIPIVSDGPAGMRELNLELGGRVSDYVDTSGDVSTAKFLVDWLVLDWMRFRGGFQKATRAPNINELFTGRARSVWGGSSAHGDVCSLNNYDSNLSAASITHPDTGTVPLATSDQSAQTLAMCQTLMGNTAGDYYGQALNDMPDPGSSGQAWITGNPDVEPETADTWTVGFVFTSPFDSDLLSGMTLSLDWFQIEVEEMISLIQPDTIITRCFSAELNPSGSIDNQYCNLIQRDPATGGSLSTDATYNNESSAKIAGVDVNFNWNSELTDLGIDFIPGGMGINLLATIPTAIKTKADDATEEIDWLGYQNGPGCLTGISCAGYDYQIFTTINYFNGPWNASLRWSHYPEIDAGAKASNPNSTALGVHDSYNLFALTGSYRFNESMTFRAGIENLFDTKPPKAGGDPDNARWARPATYSGGGIYDVIGRNFFVSANVTF